MLVDDIDLIQLTNVTFQKNNNYSYWDEESSGFIIMDSTIFDSNNYGLYVVGNNKLKIKNSQINNNVYSGLSINETITEIENSSFYGNERAIQFHSLNNDSLMLNNVVLDSNKYYGLWMGNSGNNQTKASILNSTFKK